jgi:hypothetical protein
MAKTAQSRPSERFSALALLWCEQKIPRAQKARPSGSQFERRHDDSKGKELIVSIADQRGAAKSKLKIQRSELTTIDTSSNKCPRAYCRRTLRGSPYFQEILRMGLRSIEASVGLIAMTG